MKQSRTPFRSNEAAELAREEAIHNYSRWLKETHERDSAVAFMEKLITRYGPVIEGYPCWHPITSVPKSEFRTDPKTDPQGFEGLDHTIYLRDAFITAPYGNAERVIKSALAHPSGLFGAEEIRDVALYAQGATPVLVTWSGISKEKDGTISKRFALGSMLSQEVPEWTWAECGENWERMRRYFLGTPCGSRSSLFVNQDTGKALREVHELLNDHGLWGPVHH
jgi:hypothetical protein